MTVHLCGLNYGPQTGKVLAGFLKLVAKDDIIVFYGQGTDLARLVQSDKSSLLEPDKSTIGAPESQWINHMQQAQCYILTQQKEGKENSELPSGWAPISHAELLKIIQDTGPVLTWKA